jgi:hypothetical protein
VDLHRLDTDQDPSFHVDADPDPDPDRHQNDADTHADHTLNFEQNIEICGKRIP